MNKKILLIDDEVNILNSIRRQLRGKYELFSSEFPEEGIRILQKNKDIALIISDYKMPSMDGVNFLKKTAEIAPDSVRMMLTGQADMDAVINVINEGSIFRFLTKPCPPEQFIKNINDGLRQYELITSEKELLSKTLTGSIQVMMDVMVLAKPSLFNRSMRIKSYVTKMLSLMKVDNRWQIEIAAVLSQLGCITIPDDVLQKYNKNLPLSQEDRSLFNFCTKASSELISKIPRLLAVSHIIKYQEKNFDGTGTPKDDVKGVDIPLGSRLIKIATDFDAYVSHDTNIEDAIIALNKQKGKYDPPLLEVLEQAMSRISLRKKSIVSEVFVNDLHENMYFAEELVTASGVVLAHAKQEISTSMIQLLKNYATKKEIPQKIMVLIFQAE